MLKSSTVLNCQITISMLGCGWDSTYQRRNYSFRSHYDQLQNVSTKTNSRVYVQVYIVQSVWSIISCTVCYNTFLHDGSKLFANGTADVSQTTELAISLRSWGRGMRSSTKQNNSDTWRSFLRPLWGQKCQTKLPETNLRNLLQN